MDDQRPDGYHLEGYAQARLARLAVERGEIRQGFAQAKDSLKAAVALERRPAFLKDLAIVLVELSFVCPGNRTELLERASEFADEAVRAAGPVATIDTFNAYMTLGNATEDQAFYVGRFWCYPEAIRAFEDARDLCDRLQPEGQDLVEWQVTLDELKLRAPLAAACARLRYILDAEFARKLSSDAHQSLINPEWRQKLQAAVDDININERRMIEEVETELGSLTRLYPEIAARCALHRAELLLYDHQEQAALEAFQTAYKEAVENNDPETHRACATLLIRSPLDAKLINVALENDPSIEELEAIKDVLCRSDRQAERRTIVDHWLGQPERVPPGSRPWMYLSFTDLWIAYRSKDATRNRETILERVRELISHFQDGQDENLELHTRLLLCELLREGVSKTPAQRGIAAREYASTIQWMDRQLGGHVYSLSLRGQLLAFLVDMKGEDDATLQTWFDLARRPWAGDFRIETEVPRMGMKNAIAWSEVTGGNRTPVNTLVQRVKRRIPACRNGRSRTARWDACPPIASSDFRPRAPGKASPSPNDAPAGTTGNLENRKPGLTPIVAISPLCRGKCTTPHCPFKKTAFTGHSLRCAARAT